MIKRVTEEPWSPKFISKNNILHQCHTSQCCLSRRVGPCSELYESLSFWLLKINWRDRDAVLRVDFYLVLPFMVCCSCCVHYLSYCFFFWRGGGGRKMFWRDMLACLVVDAMFWCYSFVYLVLILCRWRQDV